MRRHIAVLVSALAILVGLAPISLAHATGVNAAPSCQTVTLTVIYDTEPVAGAYQIKQKAVFKIGVFTTSGQDYNVCYSPTLTQYNRFNGAVNYFLQNVKFTTSHRSSDNALQVTMKGWGDANFYALFVTQRMTFKNFTATQYNYMYTVDKVPSQCQWHFSSPTTNHVCSTSATTSVSIPF